MVWHQPLELLIRAVVATTSWPGADPAISSSTVRRQITESGPVMT